MVYIIQVNGRGTEKGARESLEIVQIASIPNCSGCGCGIEIGCLLRFSVSQEGEVEWYSTVEGDVNREEAQARLREERKGPHLGSRSCPLVEWPISPLIITRYDFHS